MDPQRTICIFIGSGFSKAIFGQKLQNEFTDDLLAFPQAREFLSDELTQLLEKIKDIELVMSHFHNLAYSDQSKHNPKLKQHIRDILLLRTAIAVYFRDKFYNLSSEYDNYNKPLIQKFFEQNHITRDNVFFVTTNYDLAIERMIEDSFGETEFYYPSKAFSNQPSTDRAIPIFKLHGSINWMENRGPSSKEGFSNSYRNNLRIDTHILKVLKTAPLPESRQFSLQHNNGSKYTPILIPFLFQKPEWLKQNEGWKRLFYTTWELTRCYMGKAEAIYFWGYSLPPADHYLFTLLLNIIAPRTKSCIIVDWSPDRPLSTTLVKLLRYCYEGKKDCYREYKNGLIEFLKTNGS